MYLSNQERKVIEGELKKQTRDSKLSMHRSIAEKLTKCDSCPLKEIGGFTDGKGQDEELLYDNICGGCDNYKQMRELGDYLWEKETNIDYLLSKGQEMTNNEVLYLLELDVVRKQLQHALGFTSPKQLKGYLQTIIQPRIDKHRELSIGKRAL